MKHFPPYVRNNSLLFGSAKEFLSDPLNFMENCFTQYGESFRLKAGPKSIYVFTDPKHVKEILSTKDDIFVKERGPRVALGKTVLTSEGNTWKRQRKYAQLYFSKQNLEYFIPEIETIVREQIDGLSGKELGIHKFCVDIIYKLVIKIIFGLDKTDELPDLVPIVNEMIDFVRAQPAKLVKLPLWVPVRSHRSFLCAKKRLFTHMSEMLDSAESQGKKNLLSEMSKDSMASTDEIMNQALTFFVASFETTANSLFWTLYLLLKNNSYIEKIQDDIGHIDFDLKSISGLQRIRWVDLVLKESMRLYPPAWFRSRLCAKDTKIGQFNVPKGSTVWAAIYLIQRNPKQWNNANQFYPDRFLADYDKYAYIPFGGGKNLCIGKTLSIMELTIILRELFSRYDLNLKSNDIVKPKASITLGPLNDIKCSFTSRA